jgi:protease I
VDLCFEPRPIGVRPLVVRGRQAGAAICHGAWTLVEADVVRDHTLTSWPSLQADVRSADGNWVDEEAHVDAGLVTSRKPDDIDAFCAKATEGSPGGTNGGTSGGAGPFSGYLVRWF